MKNPHDFVSRIAPQTPQTRQTRLPAALPTAQAGDICIGETREMPKGLARKAQGNVGIGFDGTSVGGTVIAAKGHGNIGSGTPSRDMA